MNALVRLAIGDLEGRGVEVRPVDRVAVERWARAVDLAESAWAKVPEHLTDTGSTGQLVVHPLVKLALEAERAACSFEAHLGLDTQRRMKKPVGRPAGAVSAVDRVAKSTPARLKAVR